MREGIIDITFPYEKVVQALNYLAKKFDGKINKMKAIKLIYFSDRYHLRKYGDFLTKDKYVGMNYGPVPSRTKDITSSNIFLDQDVLEYIDSFLDTSEKFELQSKTDVDYEYLSETDIEALDFAVNEFGKNDQFVLAEITHSYPEWLAIKDRLDNEKQVEMDIEKFIEDPEEDKNACFDLDDEARTDLLDEIRERKQVDKILS